jgi:hypothetical protein
MSVGSLRVGILKDFHVRSQRLEDLEVLLAARPHSMHGRQKVLVVDGCSVSGGAGLPITSSSSLGCGITLGSHRDISWSVLTGSYFLPPPRLLVGFWLRT